MTPKQRPSGRAANRRSIASRFFASFLLLFLACSHLVAAQPSNSLPRVGFLSATSGTSSGAGSLLPPEFRKLGYIEGKNIAFEYRYANNRHDRLPRLADELVHLKIDVLVASSTAAALAAKKATRTIPIVFFASGDPISAGLVDSLARPGGNLTGFTRIAAGLAGKRLELLKQTIPQLTRVAVLWHPGNPGSEEIWKESQAPARALSLELHSLAVSNAGQFESAFQEATKARSGALFVTVSALITSNQKRIADLSIKNRLPAVYERREFVESGGLMSYGADQSEPYRRAAVLGAVNPEDRAKPRHDTSLSAA
jgi:putative ABC transport system substrate-binding protein